MIDEILLFLVAKKVGRGGGVSMCIYTYTYIYIYIYMPPSPSPRILPQNQRGGKKGINHWKKHLSSSPNQGPWGGGTIYIYIYTHEFGFFPPTP